MVVVGYVTVLFGEDQYLLFFAGQGVEKGLSRSRGRQGVGAAEDGEQGHAQRLEPGQDVDLVIPHPPDVLGCA